MSGEKGPLFEDGLVTPFVEQYRYGVQRRRENALLLLAEYEAEHGEITQDEIEALPWQGADIARSNLDRERDEAELNGSMDRGEGMP